MLLNVPAWEELPLQLASTILAEPPMKRLQSIVLVPNRRCYRRILEGALEKNPNTSTILPNILTYAEIPDNLHLFLPFTKDLDLTLPPAISSVDFKLLLLNMLKKQGDFPDILAWAAQIESFMVSMSTYGEGLTQLAYENHLEERAVKAIEAVLAELKHRGLVMPQRRRVIAVDRLIASFNSTASAKIYVSLPNTDLPCITRLVEGLYKLPYGEVYLQGVDKEMPDEIWNILEPKHPQHHFRRLLESLKVNRKDFKISGLEPTFSEIMVPGKFINSWGNRAGPEQSLDHIYIADIEDAIAEANIAAIIARHRLEQGAKRIGLIVDDRKTAGIIQDVLNNWGVQAVDQANGCLASSDFFAFFTLLSRYAGDQELPLLLEILKHRLGIFAKHRKVVSEFEISYLRRPLSSTNLEDFLKIVAEKSLRYILDILSHALNNFPVGSAPLSDWLKGHLRCYQKIVDVTYNTTSEYQTLVNICNELLISPLHDTVLTFVEYQHLLPKLVGEAKLSNDNPNVDQRLEILTAIDANGQKFDTVILTGMTEPAFLATLEREAFVSNTLRSAATVQSREEKIGLAMHNFVSLCHNSEVWLLCPRKSSGIDVPEIRFVERIKLYYRKVYGEEKYRQWLNRANEMKQWQQEFALPNAHLRPITPPRPNPVLEIRPKFLSVSAIEKLIRDPYSYYAEYILKLKKLDELNQPLSNREFGIMLHDSLAEVYLAKYNNCQEFSEKLLMEFQQRLDKAEISSIPEVRIHWRARAERIAKWLWDYEEQQLIPLKHRHVHVEIDGTMQYQGVKLFARADRIDLSPLNMNVEEKSYHATVIDYKTGAIPSIKQIERGLYPQLAIEAMMVMESAFEAIKDPVVSAELAFLELKGIREVGREVKTEVDIENVRQGLSALFSMFFSEGRSAYFSDPNNKDSLKTMNYRYLSRIDEWEIL
jgi:ATP-dependent helicase/nuclease subunit B